MESQAGEKPSPDEIPVSRFDRILQQVGAEQPDQPWYVKLGISAGWAVAISLAAALITAVIWTLITLISPNRQFTLRSLSDAFFWAAALLMLAGLVSPSASDLQGRDKEKKRERPKSLEERRERAMERRVKRVYNPWRWRVWAAAALTFGLAILSGFSTMTG
jgi:hypothetical protein